MKTTNCAQNTRDCPPGYRILFQCLDARTEQEAREELRLIFRPPKSETAKLERGTFRWRNDGKRWGTRQHVPTGYRAYLPL